MSLLDDEITLLNNTDIYEQGFPEKDDCIFLDTHYQMFCFINDNFAPYAARTILEVLSHGPAEKSKHFEPVYLYEWKNPILFKNTMFANGIYIAYIVGLNELYIILKGFENRDVFVCDLNKSHWKQACYDNTIAEDIFSLYDNNISPIKTKKIISQDLMMSYLLEIKNNFNEFYNELKCPFKTDDDYHTIDLQIHFTINDFFNMLKNK